MKCCHRTDNGPRCRRKPKREVTVHESRDPGIGAWFWVAVCDMHFWERFRAGRLDGVRSWRWLKAEPAEEQR